MPSIITGAHRRLTWPDGPPVRVKRQQPAQAPVSLLTFRGAADEAQRITARAWLVAGPAETGKTFAALYRLDSEARKWPNSTWLIVRKIRATMDSTVLGTWRRIIALRGGVEVYGGQHPTFYTYTNGARVWVVGMDSPEKVLSGEFDGAYINQAEELSEADLETITTRTTGRGAVTSTPMTFGDCNPGPADHWIIRRRDAGALVLLQSRHVDNPSLYDEAGALTEQGRRTMAVLDTLTGVRRQRLRDGLWVGAEGQFFEQWDEALHVREQADYFPIPADWPIWGAFDYGFSHNTAFGVFTRHDGIVEMLGEHVANKLLPAQHALAMDALLQRLGIPKARLRRIVAGHDAFVSKGDSDGRTIADQYAALGYVFERAQIDRINGAAQLLTRLGNATTDPPLPPTLRIWRRCPVTIATLPRMVHDPRRPEDVLKVDADSDGRGGDDAYDMVRYALMDVQPVVGSAVAGGKRPQLGGFVPR